MPSAGYVVYRGTADGEALIFAYLVCAQRSEVFPSVFSV